MFVATTEETAVVAPFWVLLWYNRELQEQTTAIVVAPFWVLLWYNRNETERTERNVVAPFWVLLWYNRWDAIADEKAEIALWELEKSEDLLFIK